MNSRSGNKGNALVSYLLDCVRRGSCSDIEAAYSDPEYSDLTQLRVGNDLSFAHEALQFMLPQIVRAAIDGGMSSMAAVKIYFKYTKKVQHFRSVPGLVELCKQIFLDFADNVARAKEDHQFSPLVRQCRSYISEHLYQPLSVFHIANALHISRSHLSRVYKQETGETISDFIRHKKISEAKLLLQHTSFSLADIGQQLGYCSQSHFTDIFRKETGLTPRQFRNKYKLNQSPGRHAKRGSAQSVLKRRSVRLLA